MANLTIIVPVYNAGGNLSRCVDSIRNQSYSDIKIILVDDGSTDGSGNICDKYADEDKRVKVIHSENHGPIYACRLGIEITDSPYVTFVDSDDWIEEDTYEHMFPYMKEGYDLVKFGFFQDYVDGFGESVESVYRCGKYDRASIENEIFPTLIWDYERSRAGVSSARWDKIFRTDIIRRSYDMARGLDFHYCEDSAIVFPLFRFVKSLFITDKAYYHHCNVGAGVSGYLKEEGFFDNLYEWYRHLMEHCSYLPEYRRQIDYAYIEAMQPRKWFYGNLAEHIEHIFPYSKVKMGSRIVIYGFGAVGRFYKEQVEKSGYCRIVAVADKKWNLLEVDGVISPKCIPDMEFDYIVIAIDDEQVRDSVRNLLANEGIGKDKIIA